MNQVPEIISTKDFAYLSDMFEWNYNISKLANHFLNEVDDEKIKDLLQSVAKMHKKHCETIIQLLNGGFYE